MSLLLANARASGLAFARYDAQDNARDFCVTATAANTPLGVESGLGGMTSRQASDETLDDAVCPTAPDQLPGWLGKALQALVTGTEGGVVSYALDPEPESVTQARHFATTTLRSWGLGRLCDDAGLVVSELVTNALRHSLPPLHTHHRTGCSGTILLRLLPSRCRSLADAGHIAETGSVLCGVVDSGVEAPRRREPDFVAETGRGLHIVESFSERWGWTPLPHGGKIVWALFGAAAS